MKISELIKNLNEVLLCHGDIDAVYGIYSGGRVGQGVSMSLMRNINSNIDFDAFQQELIKLMISSNNIYTKGTINDICKFYELQYEAEQLYLKIKKAKDDYTDSLVDSLTDKQKKQSMVVVFN